MGDYFTLAGYKVLSFDKISSTQDYAHDMVINGTARNRMAIVAAAQYAGRGRYRRKWVSHHGNLYVSFIFDAPERDSRMAYAIAVAIVETLGQFGINAKIKWPNDILIDGAKVAGVLIEYASKFIIVGIGINVTTNPTVPEYKTTKLMNYTSVGLHDLFNQLHRQIDKWMTADFSLVRDAWIQYAIGINKIVRYRGESVELIGLNESGALIVRHDSEYMLIHGDEIFV